MKYVRVIVLCLLLTQTAGLRVFATPSSEIWTNCVIDIQPAGVTHLDVDNYFSVGSNHPNDEFGTDVGLLWGAQVTKKLAAEFGFDVFGSPSTTPFVANAKIGFRENTLSSNAPALELGFFGFGQERGPSDNQLDVIQLVTGKTLSDGTTRLHASVYIGNADALRSSAGGEQNAGFMAAIDHALPGGKWVLAADFASGKNAIGGGAVGVYYYFTKDIAILTGPVWFNDKGINGGPKATVQLDVNF